ncbi:hypothetical protein RUND412_004779 [Rhizina undulata]
MDVGANYKPIVERDKFLSQNVFGIPIDSRALLARLQSLLNTLKKNHNSLRAQNDRVVSTGVAMENALKPVEDGIRIETERAAENAARRTNFTGPGEEGGEKADPVRAVGGA